METYWQAHARWSSAPAAAFEEAQRRVTSCAQTKADRLYLGDIKVDRLPPGISALTWLRELDVYGSPIADYTPIAPLGELTSLKAGSLNGAFPGLDFLRGWRELRELDLIAPTSVDLTPLAACTKLRRLDISSTQHPVELLHLEALADVQSLARLALYNMQSDHLGVLGQWTALTSVQLIGTNLATLSGFENLAKLVTLSIRKSAVTDILPLAGCKLLQSLDIAETGVRDLSPLADLPQMRTLDANGTPLRDLSPLTVFAPLEELNVANSRVSDLSPLANLASLQRARNNDATGGASSRSGLRTIDLSGCPIINLDPLSTCDRLERLNLSGTPASSLTPLSGHDGLRSLTINGAAVRELGPKGAFANLQFFSARGAPIADLSALTPANSLQAIDISDTPVSDLTPLRGARHCRTLLLRGSQVNDLSPLIKTGSVEEDHRYSPQELDFRDTPAARSSVQLAELAALADTDKHKCFVETKRFLAG